MILNNKTTMKCLNFLLLTLLCFNTCMSKLCMYVGSSCAKGGISTNNQTCHSTTGFVMTDGSIYGMKFQGVINSIKTTNSGTLILYSDSSCATTVTTIDISGLGSCQNNNVFANGINFQSYKKC